MGQLIFVLDTNTYYNFGESNLYLKWKLLTLELSISYSCFHVFSIILDHDECRTGYHECQQKCLNLHGSYYCACLRGYQLHSDNKTCSG